MSYLHAFKYSQCKNNIVNSHMINRLKLLIRQTDVESFLRLGMFILALITQLQNGKAVPMKSA
jgi:hypothetical protein